MIKKFNEYIGEGLWKSGVQRSKSGRKRVEDMDLMDLMCDKMAHLMAKYMEIDYSPDLCIRIPKPTMQTKTFSSLKDWKTSFGQGLFYIKFDLSHMGGEDLIWECWMRRKLESYVTDSSTRTFMHDFKDSLQFFRDRYVEETINNSGYVPKITSILKYILDNLGDEI